MRRYEFRLQRVKRVREVEEDLARAEFSAAEAQARAAEERARTCKSAIDTAVDDLRGLQGSPRLSPQSVITALGLVDDARRAWIDAQTVVEGLRRTAEERRQTWIARKRDVDGLERLDERSHAEYVLVREREDSLALDDTASQRDARARRTRELRLDADPIGDMT